MKEAEDLGFVGAFKTTPGAVRQIDEVGHTTAVNREPAMHIDATQFQSVVIARSNRRHQAIVAERHGDGCGERLARQRGRRTASSNKNGSLVRGKAELRRKQAKQL